ncbi:hypothetical protein AB0K52_20375 [Glycomyces sp. NPDC049804]|uniref:hypothetical protein n=1 Tax=Glycomyces sp. NPDC049804 TaxID=3154363 RepID=UPI0034482CF7
MRFLDDTTVQEFLAGGSPRLLVFGSAADLSSQVFGRQLAEFEQETEGAVVVGLIDIAKAPLAAAEWGVRPANLPVQVFFQNGVMQRVLLGVRSAQGVAAELAEYLTTS